MQMPEHDADARRYSIPDAEVTQASFDRSHVPGSRRAEEESAIAELLATLPDDRSRERMTQLLSSGGRPYEVRDPRHARLLTRIFAIRDADVRAAAMAHSIEMARGPLDVLVARVDQVPMQGARAMIMRRPTGRQRNLILVSGEASATDFADAVATMFAHRRSFGDEIYDATQARVPERTTPISSEREARFQQRLEELRAAPIREIPGIGQARAITITLGPIRANH
jgi:hypothetical protein